MNVIAPECYRVTKKKTENYVTLKVVALHMSKTCPARAAKPLRVTRGVWGLAPQEFFYFQHGFHDF